MSNREPGSSTRWRVRMGGVLVESALPLVGVPVLDAGGDASGADGPAADGPAADGPAADGRGPLPVLTVEAVVVDALPDVAGWDGRPRFEAVPGGWRCVVPRHGMVTVATDGDGILVERLPDGDDGFLSHLLLDVAVPHALAARGAVVLHGTCVADHGRAYGFLGETGMGKSTLAASFQDDGAALVADDCLVAHVDEASGTVLALPSYAALRLRAESAAALGAPGAPVVATKHLRSGRHAPSAVPLAALFLLERATPDDGSDGVEVETEVVSPARAAWEVAHRSFEASVLDERDAADAAGGVAAFVRRLRPVIERVPVVRLRYPSSFAALPEVHAAVRRWSTTAAGEGAR